MLLHGRPRLRTLLAVASIVALALLARAQADLRLPPVLPVLGQPTSATAESLVWAFVAALDAHDLERAMALLADDPSWRLGDWPGVPAYGGETQVLELECRYERAEPDQRLSAEEVLMGTDLPWVKVCKANDPGDTEVGLVMEKVCRFERREPGERFNEGEALQGVSLPWHKVCGASVPVYHSRTAVRAWLEYLIEQNTDMRFESMRVLGNVVAGQIAVSWEYGRAAGVAPMRGTAVYVVEGGRIARHSWATRG